MLRLIKSSLRKLQSILLEKNKPNSQKLLFGNKIYYRSMPKVEQKTLFTGTGKVFIGNNCCFGYKLGGGNYHGCIEIQPRYKNSRVVIGDNVSTNNNIFLCSANLIKIGNDTLIGQNVTFIDHEAHGIHPNTRREIGEIGKIIVGRNVWIGNNVIILKNTVIGANTIVATGAVVSGEFPADVIIGGIPAKIIKKIN
jgi:acetyltransferase-like isoleucine patch superfamily enzyme